jgi:outer membrane protein assembly factor BamB
LGRWQTVKPLRPAMRRKLIYIGLGLLLLLLGGMGAVAAYLHFRSPPGGELDTKLAGVSIIHPAPAPPPKPRHRRSLKYLPDDRTCWKYFGGNPQRTLSRPGIRLGKPVHHFWVRAMHSYIEYAPSYCNGTLYVNTFKGVTYAIDSHDGRVLWHRQNAGETASTPAIAGSRVIVSSIGGTVTAYNRQTGRTVWQFRVQAKVESSPVVVDGTVYFGATDGRLFALYVRTGRVRWAYNTGGRINASPSVYRNRVCITTYAGGIFCLRRTDGHKIWSTYIRRDAFRYDSFYASPSTDGRRLYTVSRSGKVVAVSATNGHVLWSHELSSWGYSTPAVAYGRVFVGDFNGYLHCYRAATGKQLWERYVGGRVLGPAVVIGKLVFFSTLETNTYALSVYTGRIVWHLPIGKYSPGIATERHYYLSLNGLLVAYWGTRTEDRRSKRHVTARNG